MSDGLRVPPLTPRHPHPVSTLLGEVVVGEIERRPDVHDRRGAQVRLTDAGVTRLRELQVTHHRVARELFLGRLSDRDLSSFAEIAERALPGVASSVVWAATEEP
jgi:hypothetical protein